MLGREPTIYASVKTDARRLMRKLLSRQRLLKTNTHGHRSVSPNDRDETASKDDQPVEGNVSSNKARGSVLEQDQQLNVALEDEHGEDALSRSEQSTLDGFGSDASSTWDFDDSGAATMTLSTYAPLEGRQIRLLRVWSEQEDDNVVEASMDVVDLAFNPCYRALSYTWGSPRVGYNPSIIVNGQLIGVRTNLFQFLKIYRHRHAGEYIWIDQICIDQKSTLERNHQVQLMKSIYRNACEVFVWLGPSWDHASRFIERPLVEHTRDAPCSEVDGEPAIVPSASERKRRACASLLNNPYWRRLWIVQELLLARSLVLWRGSETFEWAELCSALRPLAAQRSPLAFFMKEALNFNFCHPVDIIKVILKSECHDLRDLCYGIQGLLPERYQIDIDYGKSCTEVFADLAVVLVKDDATDSALTPLCSLALAMKLCGEDGKAITRLRVIHRDYHARLWTDARLHSELTDAILLQSGSTRRKRHNLEYFV